MEQPLTSSLHRRITIAELTAGDMGATIRINGLNTPVTLVGIRPYTKTSFSGIDQTLFRYRRNATVILDVEAKTHTSDLKHLALPSDHGLIVYGRSVTITPGFVNETVLDRTLSEIIRQSITRNIGDDEAVHDIFVRSGVIIVPIEKDGTTSELALNAQFTLTDLKYPETP